MVVHTMLQIRAEEGELGEPFHISCGDWAVHGSLLIWSDDFFASPMATKQKTLDHHVNFLRTEQIFPAGMRGRIHQKGFSDGKSVARINPQKHGDFGKCPFWDKRFYVLEPSSPDSKLFCSEDKIVSSLWTCALAVSDAKVSGAWYHPLRYDVQPHPQPPLGQLPLRLLGRP